MFRLRLVTIIFVAACGVYFAIEMYRYFQTEVWDVVSAGQKATLIGDLIDRSPIAQEFAVTQDGLVAVAMSLWTDAAVSIELDLELIRKPTEIGQPQEVVARSTVMVEQAPGMQWVTFRFPPITSSKDRTFAAIVRLNRWAPLDPSPPPGLPTIGLMAWAEDALRFGGLTVGMTERWGDLFFRAQVNPPTRIERARDALNKVLATGIHVNRATLALVATSYAALLLFVIGAALNAQPRAALTNEQRPKPRRRAGFLAGALLAVGVPAFWGVVTSMSRESVAVDLLDNLDVAAKDAPAGLHATFGVLEEAINGRMPTAIFAHPPSRLTWDIPVPRHQPRLKTAVALRPYVWETLSDGATFNIAVHDGAHITNIYSRSLNPRENLADRAWIDVDLDLSTYAGRGVKIILETTGGPSGQLAFDWAMWARPRILGHF